VLKKMQNSGRYHGNQGAKNVKFTLETKFRPNRRIVVFWRSFWIQNGHHSKPKWSQYGAACLTPIVAVTMVTKVQKMLNSLQTAYPFET
jgi:hypothetical protein